MAKPNALLINALRATAARLGRAGVRYRWTHQGTCNCGHLAQTLTRLSAAEIHRRALQRVGDWTEHAREHCPDSGLAIDDLLNVMLDAGLTSGDIEHLERLSCPRVRRRLPAGRRDLRRDRRADVVLYLETWAEMLEVELEACVRTAHAV